MGRPKQNGLSKKERIFVREYLKDENGTRSAIAAGYAPKSAHVTASKLLKIPKIANEIAKVVQKTCDDLEVSVERILKEISRLAYFDPRKLYDADGRAKPITELDDDTAMAISGFETAHKVVGDENDGCVVFTKIRFADKKANLELLGRYKKMWTDKVEQKLVVETPIDDNERAARIAAILAAAQKRKPNGN